MKAIKRVAAAVFLAGWTGLAGAAVEPKPGDWTVYYYEGASRNYTAKTFCLQKRAEEKSGTWGTGPTPPGSGGWAVDGNDVYFFGTVGGASFSAFGQTTGDKLITGNFVSFNPSQLPLGRKYGAFKAVFQKIACP